MSKFKKCTGKYGLDEVYYHDIENSLWVWKANGGTTYYMSALVGIPYRKDNAGTKYYPSGYLLNGANYYVGNGGLYFWGVYASTALGIKTGDWYQNMGSGVYKLKGLGSAVFTWNPATVIGHSSNTLLGAYTSIGGSGTKWIGWRSHEYSSGKNFIEQDSLYESKNIYLDDSTDARVCWWDGTLWIISASAGTKDSSVGYWSKESGDEPTGNYTLTFDGEGDDPLPEEYELAAPTYFEGTAKSQIYMGQETLWLPL